MKKITSIVLGLMVLLPLSAAPAFASSDTSAPSKPLALNALIASASQINLSWTASTDNVGVTGYNIYNRNVLIGTSTSTNFINTGLTPNTKYKYKVVALDAAGNHSHKSKIEVITLVSPDITAPSTPTLLTAIINFKNKVMLSWAAATDNIGVTGYKIMRNGTLLGTSKDTKYIDKTVATSTAYTYSVIALDANGNASASSSVVLITTPATTTPIKKESDKKENKENVIKDHKINDNKRLDQHESNHNDSSRNGKN